MNLEGFGKKAIGPATVIQALFSGLGIGAMVFASASIVHSVTSGLWGLPEAAAVPMQIMTAALLAFPLFRLIVVRQSASSPDLRSPWPVPAGIALAVGLGFYVVGPATATGLLAADRIPYAVGVVVAVVAATFTSRFGTREESDWRRALRRWAWVSGLVYGGFAGAVFLYAVVVLLR